jgi:hypothetical protein
MRALTFPLVLLCSIFASSCGIFPRRHHSEQALDVRRVVLYQNGVGYFERRGTVKGDSVRLRIRPHQIADVLKSLTVVDLGTGHAINVALPMEDTAARRICMRRP